MKQAVEMPVLWKARKTIVPFSALPTKTLKIEKTDFHIPTATTTTEQSFHLKTRKTGPDNRSHLTAYSTEFKLCAHSATLRLATLVDTLRAKGIFPTMEMRGLLMRRWEI